MSDRAAYKREWVKKNAEYMKAHRHAYYLRTKEQHRKRSAAWLEKNKDRRLEHQRRSNNKPEHRFLIYQHGAKKRGLSFEITFAEFMTFWRKTCHYCGDLIERVGIDRVDARIGYRMDNLVPCCRSCNFAKGTLTVAEFVLLCSKIALRHAKAVQA